MVTTVSVEQIRDSIKWNKKLDGASYNKLLKAQVNKDKKR